MSGVFPLQDFGRPREVFILGAGFSKAVSSEFPLTDDLGNLALQYCKDMPGRIPRVPFHDGNFESWLSRIAEGQPHLTEAENLTNRALFAEMKYAMVRCLQLSEAAAFSREAPRWLYEFLGVLHVRALPVVTFNYDTLVEVGVLSCPLFDGSLGTAIPVDDLLADQPELAGPTSHRYYENNLLSLNRTIQLYKLHGSLDWFAAPNDATGATLKRARLMNRFNDPHEYTQDLRERELPGREPFLVPPSATKSGFYENPVMRQIWLNAASEVCGADRIVLMGYSIPTADLIFSGVLEDTAVGPNVVVDVVNPKPDQVVERLKKMGLSEDQIVVTDGDDCVKKFVDRYVSESGAEFLDQLRNADGDAAGVSVMMAWGAGPSANHSFVVPLIRSISHVDKVNSEGSLVLHLGSNGIPDVKLDQVLDSAHGADRLVVRTKDGDVPVVGGWMHEVDNHHPNGEVRLAAAGKAT